MLDMLTGATGEYRRIWRWTNYISSVGTHGVDVRMLRDLSQSWWKQRRYDILV